MKENIELEYVGNGWIPYNQKAFELANQSKIGQIDSFKNITKRDIKFHRCYFALLNFIYGYMPDKFQETIPKDKFYVFIKHLKGEYTVIFEFKDGSRFIEYDSISFLSMKQHEFEDYVRCQLPYIYENLIGAYYSGKQYDLIINTIESEFDKFLQKL